MQRPAKPFTPVRFRLQPPKEKIMYEPENNSSQLDPSSFVADLRINLKYIVIVTLCFASIGIATSYLLPKTYTSESLLSTVSSSDGRGRSEIANQYGSLASAVGIDIGSASVGQKDLAIKTIRSRDFLKHLFKNKKIFKVLVAAEKYNNENGELVFNTETLNRFDDYINGDGEINYKTISPSFDIMYSNYLRLLGISTQAESKFLTVSITHISPVFAQYLLNEIIKQLNLKAKNADLIKSNQAIQFLTLAIQDTQIQEVRGTMSALLENQLKTQLMANILDEYILSVLDQPHYPIFPSSMPRKSIVAIFFFLGLLGSILFFLAKNYLKLIKNLE